MKRITALLGCFCLLILFSCKKDAVTPTTDFSKSASNSLAVTTVNGVQVNSDTIPPSNAVDVKTYGAKGDGYTDDTKAIQAAINAQTTIVLKKGTYIINSTLTLRSGVKIYGTGGAAIKAGNSMSGYLLSRAWYFSAIGINRAYVTNINFITSDKAFSLGSWANACIYIKDSQYLSIQYNKFSFKCPYQPIGIEAVWVTGTGSLQNYIYRNTCNTVGITYAEAGANKTICMSNVLNSPHSNGFASYGNVSTYGKDNQVLYNIINKSGSNGIVDYGNIDGTVITGNTINGSGKSPSEAIYGEGIQAVAVNTTVSYNTIYDAQAEYIEVAANNKVIQYNTIVDYALKAEGIVVNTTPNNFQGAATRYTSVIDHNNITGCLNAIVVFGAYTPSVSMTNNTINNPKATGIDIIANTSTYSLTASGNVFNMTTPSLGVRKAVVTYVPTKTNTQKLTLANNTFNYGTGANGGAGKELAISTCTNYVTLSGNVVNGNSVKSSAGAEVVAMDNAGITYTGYTFINNKFNNCLYWLTGFLTILKSGNNF
ncbi:glycosyl hydrolase family 28-related protein [Mucilaginibacter sp.]|jgi:polygalacturonase|uniref:glycosyl hydrolase family 28-related protein n=1 Tax=Mucilaginibacter sp. TaxID=1882438 RepID=UPI002CA67891|nr:glycosyl hydrolase family 28-related protein [Mucilaginibacter sp.]HTI59430.1 glycosyl hydrolase family 28-related protein [Mucilaginibacter sp.]